MFKEEIIKNMKIRDEKERWNSHTNEECIKQTTNRNIEHSSEIFNEEVITKLKIRGHKKEKG